VPLPWSGSRAPFGFSPPDATGEPWLPQPAHWAELSVTAQQIRPGSFLQLYCDALRIRRADPALGDGPMRWLESGPQVLAFARGSATDEPVRGAFANVTNLGREPAVLPPHREVLLSSIPLNEDGTLPPDASAWIRLA
jgi:alpha-glucosidase